MVLALKVLTGTSVVALPENCIGVCLCFNEEQAAYDFFQSDDIMLVQLDVVENSHEETQEPNVTKSPIVD